MCTSPSSRDPKFIQRTIKQQGMQPVSGFISSLPLSLFTPPLLHPSTPPSLHFSLHPSTSPSIPPLLPPSLHSSISLLLHLSIYSPLDLSCLPSHDFTSPPLFPTPSPLHKAEILGQLKKSLVDERPKNFEGCVEWARHLFQEYFHNTIAQLLYNFPSDHVSA